MAASRSGFIGRGMVACIALAMAGAPAALAQASGEAPEAAGIALELNTLQQTDNGCLFTFVAENGLDASLDKAAYEVVLFDAEGLVERMTVLDFQDLPAGRTRVRQFNLAETQCDAVSRILINDVSTCTGEGVEPGICMDRLEVASQSDVDFSN